ncbi:MAG: MOSC domain-containing protein [Planctomycetes bacterium]|nr:MOSC domain-containing protein [Planctomycetota bacterium]
MSRVVAVHRSLERGLGKTPAKGIQLLAGLGVEGDIHQGARVQHRSRVTADPSQPNLRQVHLIPTELFNELEGEGFAGLQPGSLGENLTTEGVDLLELPTGTVLKVGEALIALTGLRNPCRQIDAFRPGLLKALTPRDSQGQIARRAGVMAVVLCGGAVSPGDPILVSLPPGAAVPLVKV